MKTKTGIILLLQLLLASHAFSQTSEMMPATRDKDSISAVKEHFSLSGYAEMNYYRHYLWRGALWGSNDVAQPELHLDYKNFWLALYSNLNLRPKNLSLEY